MKATPKDLDAWWASLTVREKERIATKYVSKKAGREVEVLYPNCSNIWNDMDARTKKRIYEHVTDDHGVVLKEYKEGNTMSY